MAEKVRKEVSFQNRVEESLALFFQKNKHVLIISGAVIVLALAILIITLAVSSSQTEKNQQLIDELSLQYDEWASSEGETGVPQDLIEGLEALTSTKKSAYPALKAEYLLALISAEEKQWGDAASRLETLAENGKNTYFASLALFNLGVVKEEMGDNEAALKSYRQVFEDSEGRASESARALLSVARLHENAGDTDLAKAVLQQLADEYPESEYAKLALSHLVLL
ncbi:MAG: tetratricopeptide repeat protein [Sphaerochaetaceae bacterium]|nr:tetratricopeptide repeat protein [Sphaerochaetaceae bacterium]